MKLSQKNCLPCEGGVPKLTPDEAKELLKQIPQWCLKGERLQRRFKFKDFKMAMDFLNQVAIIAEAENHHPDFSVHYNQVDMEIFTHAIHGLSENDFILAAKLGEVAV